MERKLLCLALLLALVASGAFARGIFDSEADFLWELYYDGNSVIITGYTGSNADIRIPSRIQGLPVTVIGELAFVGNWLESVTIPDSVIYIGDDAFAENRLESVTIPDSVTVIGAGAFWGNHLTSVTIGASVIEIREDAFANNRLESVIIPDSVRYIGQDAFVLNLLESIVIGSGVTRIGSGAFAYNHPLTSVSIGGNVAISRSGFSRYSDLFGASFADFYESQGRRAGTYTHSGGVWSAEFRYE